jgi:hypothetical protein
VFDSITNSKKKLTDTFVVYFIKESFLIEKIINFFT